MGWDITIGNAKPKTRDDYSQYCFSVERAEHPDAPCWPNPETGLGDISGKSNHRAPSYTGLARWLEVVGLDADDVPAFGAKGSSGDCYVLRAEHRDAVRAALAAYKVKHPKEIPGWRSGEDGDLARLIWYEWWMTWALENCERPAIEMS